MNDSVETNEEREARLQQMRTRQHERLSVETNEEREDRLHMPVKGIENNRNSCCLNNARSK